MENSKVGDVRWIRAPRSTALDPRRKARRIILLYTLYGQFPTRLKYRLTFIPLSRLTSVGWVKLVLFLIYVTLKFPQFVENFRWFTKSGVTIHRHLQKTNIVCKPWSCVVWCVLYWCLAFIHPLVVWLWAPTTILSSVNPAHFLSLPQPSRRQASLHALFFVSDRTGVHISSTRRVGCSATYFHRTSQEPQDRPFSDGWAFNKNFWWKNQFKSAIVVHSKHKLFGVMILQSFTDYIIPLTPPAFVFAGWLRTGWVLLLFVCLIVCRKTHIIKLLKNIHTVAFKSYQSHLRYITCITYYPIYFVSTV